MKKSTLITTIAMIVVVVVALSTATYAWFSSQTATKVETTISTEGTAGWLLYGGTYDGTSSKIVYSSSTPLDMTLEDGLWSPTANLATLSSLSSKQQQAPFTKSNFFDAVIEDGEAHSTSGLQLKDANYIRIVNNNGTAAGYDNLKLTIYIVVPQGSVDGAYRAASGFKTFITTYGTGASGDTQANFTTGYNYGSLSDGTTVDENYYFIATHTNEQVVQKTDAVTMPQTVSSTSDVADANYASVDETVIARTGATSGDKYRSIVVPIGRVNSTAAINIAFYAWLDGWELDDTAAGADDLKIVYYFETATA